MFGGNFAPQGFALCDGQLLSISQNDALFSILGTTYGGDGRTTFGLPDLRGRAPMHAGAGPGRTPRPLGQKGGTETNVLNVNQLASHTHAITANLKVSGEDATTNEGAGNALSGAAGSSIYVNAAPDNNLAAGSVSGTAMNNGGNQSVNNMQPFQCVNYIIALQGLYPSRS